MIENPCPECGSELHRTRDSSFIWKCSKCENHFKVCSNDKVYKWNTDVGWVFYGILERMEKVVFT